MFPRMPLILCCVLVSLPLAAAPPPTARDVLRSKELPEVKIESASPGRALFQISLLCLATKSRGGDLDFVLLADPDENAEPFSFSGKDVFDSEPAVKDLGMRRAVEALFKLAELNFKEGELY